MRERNYRTYRGLLLLTDVIHYSVTSALQLSREAHNGTPPAADRKRLQQVKEDIEEEYTVHFV